MKIFSRSSSRVVIDGRDIVGRNVIIKDDKVIVDGVEQSGSLVGPIHVEVHGDVERVEVINGTVNVTGNAGSIKTQAGDVEVAGGVRGNVSTMSGDVETGGTIGGSVSTMSGDIIHRR